MMKVILTYIPIKCAIAALMYIDSLIVLARPWSSLPIMLKFSCMVLWAVLGAVCMDKWQFLQVVYNSVQSENMDLITSVTTMSKWPSCWLFLNTRLTGLKKGLFISSFMLCTILNIMHSTSHCAYLFYQHDEKSLQLRSSSMWLK